MYNNTKRNTYCRNFYKYCKKTITKCYNINSVFIVIYTKYLDEQYTKTNTNFLSYKIFFFFLVSTYHFYLLSLAKAV